MHSFQVREICKGRIMLVGLVCLLLVVIGFFAVHVKAASVYENIESYTEFDGEPLTHPYGMAIDSNGNIYVTDYANERIVIFNEDGTSKGEIPVGYGQLTLMRIKDDILYVVIQATNILRFDLNNNNEIIGKTLTVPQAISGLAIDSEGNIFANMYHYLYKFSPDGNQERYFFYGDFDEESRFFNSKGIALDEDDNLYVLAGNDYIHRWDKNKNYLGRWDYAYAYDFNGLFYHKGELYLTAETYTKRGFQKISATSGEILNTYTEDARGYLVFDIAVHPLTERVYVTYVRHAEPSGVWVYKDNGTTITLNVSSDEVQYGDDVTISVSVTGNDYVAPIPTGVIRIKDGAEELMELDLINGQADFTTSSLLPGDRMIRAVYSGDDHFPEDSSEEFQIKVNKIPSTTTLQTSNPNIGAGESVTFTATVSGSGPGGETPTGTVTFMDGGEVLAVEALVDGTATVNVNNLASGERTITALYSGDSMFKESEQTIQQTVEKVSTVTNVTASPALSKYGENVTITATVTSSNNGIPTGNVKFTNGATELGTTILDNGSASLDVSNLLVGDHTITVEYEGDSSYSASSSTIALKVEKANTTTVLTTSESSSSYGENVSFTVAVTANAPGSGTPTGEVTFKNEDKVLGTATLNDGTATLSGVNNLLVGSYTITAQYSGDGSFLPSSDAIQQVVGKADTSTNVSTSLATSTYGDTVTFTATVTVSGSASETPSGTVTFMNGDEKLGEATLDNGNIATLNVSHLPVGYFTIKANYSGDHLFKESSGTVTQTVEKAKTTINLVTAEEPTVYGQSVTFTATVTALQATNETPTGKVTFKKAGVEIAQIEVIDGTAIIEVDNLDVGTHTITAEYQGDSTFLASIDTVQQRVNKANTQTSATTSNPVIVFGEDVTLSATITAVAPGAGVPSGNLRFSCDSGLLGNSPLVDGTASLKISELAVGNHTITVEYEGDSSYSASSDALALKVEKANTTTEVTTSESSSSYGENVSFTATVIANAPGSGTPTGEVTFKNEDKVLGIATLNDGTATLSGVNNLSVGSHTITAHYSGDGSFIPSDGAVVQTVTGATVTMNVTTSIPTSLFGEEVTYTVKVTPKISNLDQPTGEVTFINGTEELGKVPLTNGIAALSVTNLMVGEHTISVIYSGDHIYDSESTTVQQLVNKANTTTNATTSDDRSIFGEKVTLTATVTVEAPGRGTPSGTVTFKHGAEEFGTAVLDGGTASLDISTLPVGEYEILVQYNGDHSFLASSDTIDQEVNQASSTTSIVASTSSSVSGENVTFTATVESSSHGTPSGHVKFMNGTQELGEVALRDGTATLTGITNLSVGDHTVTAEYSGDSSFLPSRDTVQHTVNKAITTTNVTAAKTDILEGESITLTANVMVNSPGTGIPTGKVTFLQKTEVIGEVILTSADAGVAELLLPKGLDVGRYEVHVQYDGDARFLKSQSKAVVLTVSRRSSSSDGDTSFPSTPSQPTQPRQVVATDGKIILPPRASGAVSLGKNITVTLPAGLSNEEVRLTIEELVEYTEFISEDHELLSNVYEILSSLTGTFSKAITITIVFDPTMLNEGQKASIFYFDEANEEWIEVGGVVNGNKISATIDHLTKFAVFAVDDSSPPQSETDLAVTLSDIRGHWAESSIVKAIESGIVNGYPDGTFRPNKPVTRAEFTVMLMNGLKLDIHPSDVNFTDRSQIGTWAIQAISQAVQAEIIRGYEDGSFKPNANINRTEMVVMIANALDIRTEHLTATSFSDDKDIPTWAKGAVETIRNLGIVSGRSNDLFVPKENATRAEAITIILKMLEQK